MTAYGGKQRAVFLCCMLRHAPSQHTCCSPRPALAVVPLPSMLEELGAANPKTLYAFIGRVWPQGRSLLGRD